ncbi:hypothetical protein RhiJN_06233 [Ceratobasidium sp. AG-Ba]|nr:hypothetical protein RhiJN_06233 [Ceratobasidium sp. AG-Ba]QRW07173.1 hypothetical protein RhiLY_06172 [Ceratobasidium sp. AG-Ba]
MGLGGVHSGPESRTSFDTLSSVGYPTLSDPRTTMPGHIALDIATHGFDGTSFPLDPQIDLPVEASLWISSDSSLSAHAQSVNQLATQDHVQPAYTATFPSSNAISGFAAVAGSADRFHNATLPLDPLSHSQLNVQAEGYLSSYPGPLARLRPIDETLGDISIRDLDSLSFAYTASGLGLFPQVLENYATSIPNAQFHLGALLDSVTLEVGPLTGSGCNSRKPAYPLVEVNQGPEIVDEDGDPEGVVEIFSPTLALDRGVSSNLLPYLLSISLRWMTRSLFEPMFIAHRAKGFLIQRCAMSDKLWYAALLGATVADVAVRDPKAVFGDSPVIAALEHYLIGKLVLAKSGLEVQLEPYGYDAWGLLRDTHVMMTIRALSSSMLFHAKTLDQIVPVYQLAAGTPLGTVLDLQSHIDHLHPVFLQTTAMDIMLGLATCRLMSFRYDATATFKVESENRIGLYWKSGLPDEFLYMLGQMNMLRQDRAPPIDSATIHSLQSQIDNFQPMLNRRTDSYLYIERLMVQECWRQFMYTYLYMVKPGRTPDAFLVTPMSLAGIAAHKKRHREVIRGRLCGLYEYSQPGTYVNDASRIMEGIWTMADMQGRPAVWSDLRYACFMVTGIV